MAKKKPVKEFADIAWEGDSLEVLRDFPKPIRAEFGSDLFLLQQGEQPRDYRSMSSVGSGVFELRQRDADGWYRVIYLSRINNVIHVLHSFQKKSAKTSKRDLGVATDRLKGVRQRLREEKKNA